MIMSFCLRFIDWDCPLETPVFVCNVSKMVPNVTNYEDLMIHIFQDGLFGFLKLLLQFQNITVVLSHGMVKKKPNACRKIL